MTRAPLAFLGLLLCACGGTTHADASQSTAAPPSAAGAECGNKGQPDCALQGWMKSTLQTYQRAKDYARLEKALKQLAEHAPDGYGEWKSLAEAGAQAAHAQDETAVSKSCKACHNEYRQRFRKERRAQPLF